MSAPLLETADLHKSYRIQKREVPVLTGVDFALAPGESVAIIGPSGAGKSTLLNLLGSLDEADAGEILYRGRSLRHQFGRSLQDWRSRIVGFVFQFHFLLPDFTALENLLIPVRMRGGPSRQDRERARELLERLELTARADHMPGELSGGEQQRVAVARAFMNRPEIILADEPFGNLDQDKGRRLGDLLFELGQRENTSLVIVTHDLGLAGRADRVLELTEGRLRAAGADGGGGA